MSKRIQIKLTTKKSIGFYIKATVSLLKGTVTKKPVKAITISALGNAVNVAGAVAAHIEKDGLGRITKTQTAYLEMSNKHSCCQITIDIEGLQGGMLEDAEAKKRQNGQVGIVDMSEVVLILSGPIQSSDFIKLLQAARNPVGVTGDQSLIEGVFLGKVPYYETMEWKHAFSNNFRKAVSSVLGKNSALESFLRMCYKEPKRGFSNGNLPERVVKSVHLERAASHADLFLGRAVEMHAAMPDLAQWIKDKKNFGTWLLKKLEDIVPWEHIRKENMRNLRVLITTDNPMGFGNCHNVECVANLVQSFTLCDSVSCSVRCVITTLCVESGSTASPAAIKDKFPQWDVPVGSAKKQLQSLKESVDGFDPDLVILSPASAYDIEDLRVLRRFFPKGRQARPQTLWLGEYGDTTVSDGTRVWGMGVGEKMAGVLVPDVASKLEGDCKSSLVQVLLSASPFLDELMLFFAYFHSEGAVRDYLLLVRALALAKRRRAVVVMPRMMCVDGDECDFRNMSAMLESLVDADGSFGGSLRVYHAGRPEEIVKQWDLATEECSERARGELSAPHFCVSDAHGLLDAMGAASLKSSIENVVL